MNAIHIGILLAVIGISFPTNIDPSRIPGHDPPASIDIRGTGDEDMMFMAFVATIHLCHRLRLLR